MSSLTPSSHIRAAPVWRTELALFIPSVVIALIVAIPLLAVLGAVFLDGGDAWAHLVETQLLRYVLTSLALMVWTASLALVFGVSTAWLIGAADFPGRRMLGGLLVLPLAAPAYIIAYFYTDLLAVSGPVQSALRGVLAVEAVVPVLPELRSIWGAGLMLALVLYPYVYLLAQAAFRSQSRASFVAARTLGAGPWRAFFTVALPTARPAILGGLSLVMMETLADYGVADYFALTTFSTGIFRVWLGLGEAVAALKLAAVLLVFIALLIWLEAANRKGRIDDGGRLQSQALRLRLGFVGTCTAWAVCAVPIVLGFIIPVVGLAVMAIEIGDPSSLDALMRFAFASIKVAGITAISAAVIALFLAYVRRLSRSAGVSAGLRLATLGYALPGALLAVGLLGAVGPVDQWLSRHWADWTGMQSGLLLSGGLFLLILAYVTRFLTVSFNAASSALMQIAPVTDAAARSLGKSPVGVLRAIHFPLARRGLFAGLLLVFVDVMRELPLTLILRPFNFDTLATRVYSLASDERLTEASTAALAIIAIGLLPALLLQRGE